MAIHQRNRRMKIINYPEKTTIGNATFDLSKICEQFVFGHEFWRRRENIGFALTLMPKLKAEEKITDDEHEALEKGMRLEGQIVSQELNPYYLKCLSAVYSATSTKTVNEKETAK